jgi:hypothetical protein
MFKSLTKREKLLSVLSIALIALLIASTYAAMIGTDAYTGRVHAIAGVKVNVSWVFQTAKDGVITGSSGNLITDIGDQYIANVTDGLAQTGGAGHAVYIALGNGTNLAYSDTQLTTETASSQGFSRSGAITPTPATGLGSTLTPTSNGYYFNFTLTNKFTASVTMTVNATSIQWYATAGSNGNMFAEASIGTLPVGQLFNANDNCTISYTFTETH